MGLQEGTLREGAGRQRHSDHQHTYTHTHTHSHHLPTLTRKHMHSHSHTDTHPGTLTLTHAVTHTLSLSLSHTHTHTHACVRTHAQTAVQEYKWIASTLANRYLSSCLKPPFLPITGPDGPLLGTQSSGWGPTLALIQGKAPSCFQGEAWKAMGR